jgi:hypothetical protein
MMNTLAPLELSDIALEHQIELASSRCVASPSKEAWAELRKLYDQRSEAMKQRHMRGHLPPDNGQTDAVERGVVHG